MYTNGVNECKVCKRGMACMQTVYTNKKYK